MGFGTLKASTLMRTVAASVAALLVVSLFSVDTALAQKGTSDTGVPPSEDRSVEAGDAFSFEAGLKATLDSLDIDSIQPDEAFLSAGTQFLRAVERAFQSRYRYGVNVGALGLALMGTGLPGNPDPEPFSGAVIEDLFSVVLSDMADARATLATFDNDADFSVAVDLSSVWFDVNDDDVRQPGEGLLQLTTGIFNLRGAAQQFTQSGSQLVVDFDQSDAAWLTAYTHFISATSRMVLAFSPGETLDEVFTTASELDAVATESSGFIATERRAIDLVYAFLKILEKTPNADDTRAAREHMLAMIANNRIFWERVAAETDSAREWIPNQAQVAALPIEFPGEVGPSWLAVLSDLEALLEGRLLAPHWRLGMTGATHGINIRTLFENPQSMDMLSLFQGGGIAFAVEEGPIISTRNWQQFQSVVGRRRGFLPLILN
ncbi:MAG: hypothetical protein AAF590_12705 [Pseudomonadota bacterium]